MAKLILTDIAGGFQLVSAYNANNTLIETALENTLSRDGTAPNQMSAALDMNGNEIPNLGPPTTSSSAARLSDISDVDATGAASAVLRSDLGASSGSSLSGFLQNGAGAIARTLQDKVRDTLSFADYVTLSDADHTVALQAVIDYASANGIPIVDNTGNTYIVGDSGSTISGRAYGLLLKSDLDISGSFTFKAKDASEIDVINTDRAASVSNVSLKDFTIDGNEANQTNSGFNLWAFDITNFDLDITSINPGDWGIRIQKCNEVDIHNTRCDHSAESNSDGIHFIDTINVVGGEIYIKTLGDDAFIIEALGQDVYNYSIGNIIVQAPTSAVSAGKRGVLLLQDVAVATGARTISNISIGNVVAKDCVGQAVILQGASYYNIDINFTVDACSNGLYLIPGTLAHAGTLTHCSFEGIISNTTDTGVTTLETYGTISDNNIDVQVVNPADNTNGVNLRGDTWSGRIVVDYDPNGTKVTPLIGINVYGTDNSLFVSSKDANNNLYLQGTADNNNFKLGHLKGGVTTDLTLLAGSQNNTFTGGRIAGTITNSSGDTSNKFVNVRGASDYAAGSVNMTTEGDGTAVIAHGLGSTPQFAQVTGRHPGVDYIFNVIALDATNIDVQVYDASAGAVVTAGIYNVYYDVRL